MDNIKQNIKNTISLDKQLNSYSSLIIFTILFIILSLFLYIRNPDIFNKILGKEIFITGTMIFIFAFLFRDLIAFKNNPQSSFLGSLDISKQTLFLPFTILLLVILGIGSIFTMLYISGSFDNPPPENNISIILNFIIIALFIAFASYMYFSKKDQDNKILNTYPKYIQDLFTSRTNYTIIFFLFVLFVLILYFVNPYGIATNYGTPTIFFIIFIGLIFVGMITIYNYGLSNPNKVIDLPNPLQLFLKGFYIIISLFISGLLIYYFLNLIGVFEQNASKPESWGKFIFNILLFSAMLGIIYKLINAGGFLDKNPVYRLILNTLLYIPCLLVSITNYIVNFGKVQSAAPPTKNEIIILIVAIILIVSYFLITYYLSPYLTSKYLKQGGTQLINQPINLDKQTNIATYQQLNNSDSFDYQYALSFWIYIDSFPPSTNSSYLKVVPLLSYGENPIIKYSSKLNTLYITVKNNDEQLTEINKNNKELTTEKIKEWNISNEKITDAIQQIKLVPFKEETDVDGHRIIYEHQNVKLQKWNHIVVNYSGGTLDIFYNGKLVKSAINVVPYMKYDMLISGSDNGILGNIANVMYFKNPLDILTINTLYMSLKNTNPPCINKNKNQLIELSQK